MLFSDFFFNPKSASSSPVEFSALAHVVCECVQGKCLVAEVPNGAIFQMHERDVRLLCHEVLPQVTSGRGQCFTRRLCSLSPCEDLCDFQVGTYVRVEWLVIECVVTSGSGMKTIVSSFS